MFVCAECGQSNPTAGFCPEDGSPLVDRGDDVLIGSEIGVYRVARLLGVGGMGRVYKAVHPSIGSRVAVKVLSYECAQNAEMVDRFLNEAKAVNLIRHENIVNIIDLNKLPDGRPYIIMEYLDGAALADVIEKQGPLPLGGLAKLVGEVLSALGAAHRNTIVHRDLKPDNIFVSPQGRATVLDFGIAKLRPELSGGVGPTRTGSLLGTPHYMAPEQAMAQRVDARTDVYAVGVILYESVTGRRPFQADSLFQLLHMQVNEQPTPPRALRPDLPPEYEAVIFRAMAKDPAHRFQSTDELAHALDLASRALPAQAWTTVTPATGGSHAASIGPQSVRTPAHGGAPVQRPASMGSAATPMHTPTPGGHTGYPTNTPMSGQMMHPQTAHRVPNKRTGLKVGIAVAGLAVVGAVAFLMTQSDSDDSDDRSASTNHASSRAGGAIDSLTGSGRNSDAAGRLADLSKLAGLADGSELKIDLNGLQSTDPVERQKALEKLTNQQLAMADKATKDALTQAQNSPRTPSCRRSGRRPMPTSRHSPFRVPINPQASIQNALTSADFSRKPRTRRARYTKTRCSFASTPRACFQTDSQT